MNKPYAIVRPPGRSYINAINEWYQKSHPQGKVILNWEKAIWQHKQYVKHLQKVGVHVIQLPTEEKFPDGCFTQDPAVVCEKDALLTRQFSLSRRGEGMAVGEELKKIGLTIHTMNDGFCDGGDVLVADDLKKVWIGISQRTDKKGFVQIRKLFEKYAYKIEAVPVTKSLHLLTGMTYLGKGIFLISELTDKMTKMKFLKDNFNVIEVSKQENYAANALIINNSAIMPEGYPIVGKTLSDLGYRVLTVPMSEFEKVDGGVSCLSLLFRL